MTYRGYPLKKIQENNEAEIMEVVLEEAYESFEKEIIKVFGSEHDEEIERNADEIVEWIKNRMVA